MTSLPRPLRHPALRRSVLPDSARPESALPDRARRDPALQHPTDPPTGRRRPGAVRVAAATAVGALVAAALAASGAAPATAASSNAVTGTSVSLVNVANSGSGSLEIHGTTAAGVTGVVVALDDQDDATDPLVSTADLGAGQTWSVSFTMAAVRTLDDGSLTIQTAFDGDAGPDAAVDKDTLEPDNPTALPDDAETLDGPQLVEITALDPADQGRTHYTVGTSAAPAPTASDPVVPTKLLVASSEQVRAVSFDAAGNRSATMVLNFVVRSTAPASPPPATPGTPGTPGSPAVRPHLVGALDRPATGSGSSVNFVGSVAPYRGTTLVLKRRVGHGAWTTVARRTVPVSARNGAFRFPVHATGSGTASYAVTASGAGLVSTTSAPATLRVYRVSLGRVVKAGKESVTIANTGRVAVQLGSWWLRDANGRTVSLHRYVLRPGATVVVRTGAGRDHRGVIQLGSPVDHWHGHGVARLFDANGAQVASRRF